MLQLKIKGADSTLSADTLLVSLCLPTKSLGVDGGALKGDGVGGGALKT